MGLPSGSFNSYRTPLLNGSNAPEVLLLYGITRPLRQVALEERQIIGRPKGVSLYVAFVAWGASGDAQRESEKPHSTFHSLCPVASASLTWPRVA